MLRQKDLRRTVAKRHRHTAHQAGTGRPGGTPRQRQSIPATAQLPTAAKAPCRKTLGSWPGMRCPFRPSLQRRVGAPPAARQSRASAGIRRGQGCAQDVGFALKGAWAVCNAASTIPIASEKPRQQRWTTSSACRSDAQCRTLGLCHASSCLCRPSEPCGHALRFHSCAATGPHLALLCLPSTCLLRAELVLKSPTKGQYVMRERW